MNPYKIRSANRIRFIISDGIKETIFYIALALSLIASFISFIDLVTK